jgi:tRNA pseudouridine38-40 synthase
MSRVRLTLAYDGTDLRGFQRLGPESTRDRSVAGTLEARLAELCGHPVNLVGAGRTDAGVHAVGQVAHFDKMGGIPVERLERVLNATLMPEIRVSAVEEVCEDFHARYSAVSRTYHYFLCAEAPSPMLGRYVWWVPEPAADRTGRTDRLSRALSALDGTHDFGAFCTDRSEAGSTVRTVLSTAVETRGPMVRVALRANGFLRSMVRLIVGELVEIAAGRAEVASVEQRLADPERVPGKPAPAQGLFLAHVEYPDGYGGREERDLWPPFL